MEQRRKIILFGGTFDPVHSGHIEVCKCALEKTGGEKVIFIPAKRSPLKQAAPRVSDEHRMKMLELAVEDIPGFEISDYEIKKKKPSYTLHTVRYFRQIYGEQCSIYWLAGCDVVDELKYWYGILELVDECNLCIMYRGGYQPPDFDKYTHLWGEERVNKLKSNIIETPRIEISSSQVRSLISEGIDVEDKLDKKVVEYIFQNNLYKNSD
jgi:nicotinate-nucleotide adenylyltransferase